MGATALTIGMLAGTGLDLYESHEQKIARDNAIEQQRINARARANSERLKEDDRMKSIISSNIAKESAGMFAPSSGSYAALAEGNIEQFSTDRNIVNLNLSNTMKSLDMQEGIAGTMEGAQNISDIFSGLMTYYRHKRMTSKDSGNDWFDNFFGD